jgi:ribosomal protein S18 acetylase RimI-like enzyme
MEIRKVLKQDIMNVVEIHKTSFKDFFLTKLGDDFLTLYYDCLRKDERSILIGIYDNSKLCGFCAASYLSKGFNYQLIKNHFVRFLFFGIRLLFSKPAHLIRLFNNLTKHNPDVHDNSEYAELLSIGVFSDMQNQGIGKQLLLNVEEKLKLNGCSKLSLTTDYYNNEKAMNFYKGLGYNIYYEFIAYPDRKMYRLIKKIS